MSSNTKHTYVLIAGAWHGGWVWRDVIPQLRLAGHAVTAPTLTGLGERRHAATNSTGLQTHIQDIVEHIEMEGLSAVTLVGWSYGGMVLAGVASRIPERIKSVIYVDAFVPEDGKSMFDYLNPDVRAHLEGCVSRNEPIPPMPLELFGVTEPAIVEFMTPRLVPQPSRTFVEPVQLSPLPESISVGYLFCSGYQALFTHFYEQAKDDPRVKTAAIDTGHVCMLTEPAETARLLLELA